MRVAGGDGRTRTTRKRTGTQTGPGQEVPLLAAKLATAPLPDPVLVRPRLFDLLDRAVAGPVTLVRAPAGWGKTTLLASWFHARPAERTTGWLSVGTSDSGRLWSYLYAALTPAVPDAGAPASGPPASVPGLPASVTGPPEQETVERLAVALADRTEPVVLVCDDLHLAADPDALTALEFLLRHADERLRLVVGTRTEPSLALHRFRVSGELTELRATDLAFTDDEVADLLTAHGAVVPPDAVAALRERTEGWPVGLRLAALALRGHPDPARFVDRFGGDQPEVAEYLTGEVLNGLAAEPHAVLACTAFTEPVTAELVNALTGRDDADRVLAELEQRTGFLIASGERPAAYRCHRLLADLLRAELSHRPVDDLRELHRRAARWYATSGHPGDALRHLLAAGDGTGAAELLLDQWPELVPYDRDEVARVPTYGTPQTEPDLPAALALAHAAERLDAADLPAADGYLRTAALAGDGLTGPAGTRSRRALAALQLAHAQLRGEPDQVRTAADRLLQLAPLQGGDAREHAVRAVARTAFGLAALGVGQLDAATGELTAARTEAGPAGLRRVALVAASRIALIAALRGELRVAEQAAAEALALPPCRARPARRDCGYAYLALALVALHRNQPAEAEANLALAERPSTDGCAPDRPAFVASVARCRSQLLRDRGEPSQAYQVLADARAALGDATPGGPRNWLLAAEAELRAGHGDLTTARELLTPRVSESTTVAVALARVEFRADDPGAAARALPDWDGPGAARLPLAVRVEAGTLDALIAWQARDHRRAARILERVLELAEPDGLRRFLIQGEPPLRDLLAAHLDSGTAYWPTLSDLARSGADPAGTGGGTAVGAGPAPPGEPLTDRELTILRYLQSILSNVEIASELSVSVNTVKTHVRNIYRKLDATRRREAVRRARELHLL